MKKIKMVLGLAVVSAIVMSVYAETKYAAGLTATGAAVNFASHKDAASVLKYVNGQTGANSQKVEVYVRNAASPYVVVGAAALTNILVSNPGIVITNLSKIMYQYANGTVAYAVCQDACTATNIVFTPALATAGAAGDKVYVLTQVANFDVGTTNTAGVATWSDSGDAVIVTPTDSPVRVFMNGSTNNYITATVQ